MRCALLVSALALTLVAHAQGPDLVGYWHNWNDAAAPYIELDQIDPRYTVIEVSFAEPAAGTTFDMVFAPALTAESTFIAQVATLQAQGRKVLLSIGGANATVQLNSDAERDQFVQTILGLLGTYGFDGIDIDLEGASVNISGGTIGTPVDASIIRLIDAVVFIGDAFEAQYGVPMMLTMAPETAFVQGGQSAFGGIWGAYLPVIDALRNRIDILQVQLYNSGSMYGIDGGIYSQGTADFIVSQTEALLQGFTTGGGFFAPLPPQNIAISLPACPLAAGGGYVDPAVLSAAINYLRGTGPQPGSYTRSSTYPDLRGLMTWSINWDAVSSCASTYEYAQAYSDIFSTTTELEQPIERMQGCVWPTFIVPGDHLHIASDQHLVSAQLIDPTGRVIELADRYSPNSVVIPSTLSSGHYMVHTVFDSGVRCYSHLLLDRP